MSVYPDSLQTLAQAQRRFLEAPPQVGQAQQFGNVLLPVLGAWKDIADVALSIPETGPMYLVHVTARVVNTNAVAASGCGLVVYDSTPGGPDNPGGGVVLGHLAIGRMAPNGSLGDSAGWDVLVPWWPTSLTPHATAAFVSAGQAITSQNSFTAGGVAMQSGIVTVYGPA